MSSTGTTGRLFLSCVQRSPRSTETYNPTSLPTNKRLGVRWCSVTTLTDQPSGRTVRDRRPVLAVVLAGEHVGRVVPVAVPVEGRVHPTLHVFRRLDPTHIRAVGQPWHPVLHVLPRGTVVAAHLNVPVIRTDVQQTGHER